MPGICDRDLNIHVFAPGSNFTGLALHFMEFVRKNLERNRAVLYVLQKLARKLLIIGDTALSHQSWIGGKSGDTRITVKLQNAIEVSPVGKNFYFQLIECF